MKNNLSSVQKSGEGSAPLITGVKFPQDSGKGMVLEIEELQEKDILEASKLVDESFFDAVASTLTDEGIHTFRGGLTPESIKQRLASGNIFVICKEGTSIVGVAEVRDRNHLNLLFVEPSLQRKGIGRKLFNDLISRVCEYEITVNSSLNAIAAYTKYGFQETGPKDEVRGISYQPMAYKIERQT